MDEELIRIVEASQERNILHIAGIMRVSEVDTLPKIRVWIFNSDREKYVRTQVREGAHAITEYWSVYHKKSNARSAHEVGHIMSQHYWGYPKSQKYRFMLEEGFAFYLDEGGFIRVNLYEEARELVLREEYKLSTIVRGNSQSDFRRKALVCGAFDKYLIASFGIEKFAVLWKNVEKPDVFDEIYGKGFDVLENEFYAFLGETNAVD